ncbi:hypothetical protein IS481_12905 [Caldimonas thermodepolymerans]|uniref:hypothetical protein n=1 Tax=Caldimonas thermodepolymerans TaxID=215580 RepID=UPI0011B0B285|nr:hypothetical protein [Caldimonas thermodepolymerans]QPC30654.1 hypothetical protein IS481_12905 [Caldimonas thermodepolymerans]
MAGILSNRHDRAILAGHEPAGAAPEAVRAQAGILPAALVMLAGGRTGGLRERRGRPGVTLRGVWHLATRRHTRQSAPGSSRTGKAA